MDYIDIKTFYKDVVGYPDEEVTSGCEEGIKSNFCTYVQRKSPDKIKVEDNGVSVQSTIITPDYIKEYFVKNDYDFSAKDCAELALNHVGIPPLDDMSLGSLAKITNEIMRQNKDKIYIKYGRGKSPTRCVDYSVARTISEHPDVLNRIAEQTRKADNKGVHKSNDVEWIAYKFAKEKIDSLDALNDNADGNDSYRYKVLSTDEKTYLMVQAIYNALFTEFDFEKYEKYSDEIDLLYDNWDFQERYQELYDIFHSSNYRGEFYQFKPDSNFMELLSDKIAEKIIKKLGK